MNDNQESSSTQVPDPPVPEAQQPGEVWTTPGKSHKKPLIIAASVVIALAIAGILYSFFSKPKTDIQTATTPTTKAQTKQELVKATQKVVKVTFTNTTPLGAQNSLDNSPILANGSYLELNGNGELNYNGSVIIKDKRIRDAVLSKNGKHYAYRLELQSQDFGLPAKSELYIDAKKVAGLGQTYLLAVADDGTSYLTKDYTSKITGATYNTGIREEIIKLNGSNEIISSPYGYIGGEYSPDLKNILTEARNYAAGSTWYSNGSKLNNCSYEWNGLNDNAPSFGAVLSNDGSSNMCTVYHLGKAQPGSNLVYNITKLQIFIDDSLVFDQAKILDTDGISLRGFADKSNWLLVVGGNVILSDGSVKSLADFLPEVASALKEPGCANLGLEGSSLAYVSNDQLALLIPCTKQKLFSKGFAFANTADLSQQKYPSLQYSAADHTLYMYEIYE
jgi:flagellar basal body-associated protein FliL